MPKLTQLEELDVAIKMAAADAESAATNIEIATAFFESHRELVQPLMKRWAIDRLANLIANQRREKNRNNDAQLVFEELLGFKHLPKKIEVKPGKSVPRADAKIEAFRKLASARIKSPAQIEAQRIVALMSPYAKKDKNITYGEALKKEAEKKAKRDGLTLPLFGAE